MDDLKYLSDQWEYLIVEDKEGNQILRITKDELLASCDVVVRLKPIV